MCDGIRVREDGLPEYARAGAKIDFVLDSQRWSSAMYIMKGVGGGGRNC